MKHILLCILILLAFGCGYNNTTLPEDSLNGSNQNLNTGNQSLDFATIKSQVFQGYCLRCHSLAGGNKGGINLEVYGNVNPLVQRISSAVSSGFMPQSGTLPGPIKLLLLNWIQAGAPEFATSTPGDQNNPNPIPAPVPGPCDDHRNNVDSINRGGGEGDCPRNLSITNEGI